MTDGEKEQIKLRANALDRTSTACVAAGLLAPAANVLYGGNANHHSGWVPFMAMPEAKSAALPIALATSHHAVAVRKFNEATVHLSSRENAAQLALTVLSVPSVGVREVLHLLLVLWLDVESRGLSWLNHGGFCELPPLGQPQASTLREAEGAAVRSGSC